MTDRHKGIACIIASAFGFAMMGLFIALSDYGGWFGGEISTFQKSFFRNLVAVFVAGGILARRARHESVFATRPAAKEWGTLACRCICGAAGIFANFYALSHIPLGDGMMLNKLSPFFTVLFAWMFLSERMTLKSAAALAGAFIGSMFIVKPTFATGDLFARSMGFFGGVMAGAAYACLRALSRGRSKMDASFIVFTFSLFSTLSAVPFMVADFDPMTPAQVAILVGAGVSATVGQFGITAAYRFAPPREIAVYDYTNIMFAAILGWIVLGQTPDAYSVTGFAIIIAMGIWMHHQGREKK